MEISYPGVCYNVIDGGFQYTYDGGKTKPKTFKLPTNVYEDAEQILKVMQTQTNKQYGTKNRPNRFETKINQDGTLYMKASNAQALTVTSHDLAEVLGLERGEYYPRIDGVKSGERHSNTTIPMNLTRIHSVMVYIDIISSRIVGDVKAPLLRSFVYEHRSYQAN